MVSAQQLENETILLRELSHGSQEAFSALYRHYQPRLHRFLTPFKGMEDPDEVIHDIFIKLWLKKETLPAIASFEQYIFRMAKNRLLDLHKGQEVRDKHETAQGNGAQLFEATTENAVLFKEFQSFAAEAINKLPERQREIYVLSMLQDKSNAEIAAMTGLSHSVVKKQLYFATKALKEYISKYAPVSIAVICWYWVR